MNRGDITKKKGEAEGILEIRDYDQKSRPIVILLSGRLVI